jgi:hypothetical protein
MVFENTLRPVCADAEFSMVGNHRRCDIHSPGWPRRVRLLKQTRTIPAPRVFHENDFRPTIPYRTFALTI